MEVLDPKKISPLRGENNPKSMVLYCFHGAARRPGNFCAFLLPSGIVFLHFKSDLDLQNDTFPFKKRYIPPKISACGGPIVPKTPFKNTPPLKDFCPF